MSVCKYECASVYLCENSRERELDKRREENAENE